MRTAPKHAASRHPASLRPTIRRSVLALFAAALIAVLAACSTAPIDTGGHSLDPSSTLRSDGPQVATLPDADPVPVQAVPRITPDTERIIALDRNNTLAEIVWALGFGSHVVARGESTTFPGAQKLPVVTDRHAIVTEKVLAANPTMVIAGNDSTPKGVLDQLREAGIRVVEVTAERSVANTPEVIRTVAAALHAETGGDQLVERTQAQIDQAKAQLPDPTGDPVMAFLYIRGERLILLAGPGSGADDLIAELGGQDAGTKAGLTSAFTQVSTESMMRANPDVILVMTHGADSLGGMDKVLALPAVAGTKAGQARRIVEMDDSQILSFGPDTGLVLSSLAKAIYR